VCVSVCVCMCVCERERVCVCVWCVRNIFTVAILYRDLFQERPGNHAGAFTSITRLKFIGLLSRTCMYIYIYLYVCI